MANPEHIETLDLVDKISVIGYRLGLSLFSVSLAWYCIIGFVESSWGQLPSTFQFNPASLFIVATLLSAGNLHVYDKNVRSIIMWSGWLGIALFSFLINSHFEWVAYGFIFVAFSGIALKESFCFRVFGLKLIPLLLFLTTLFMAIRLWTLSLGLIAICTLIFSYLTVQKWKMPLHFDIGNKSNYQI
ncbi:DUF2301 domain-containing membrane protein [Vibrio sp. ZSDE26]|uniref:DUF2301 domain-containing membrane protein n=1 Tax=Vibrio amylolyticus TaxID=2847292 RepID=A0A9X2BI35_9VIBR|nr:DUF2301 domain-containing membrane protein [Vibrio amylolyticus]MCK6263660.1 DUF2301 domain-containing membrane protein [Vibrio amylolyticus]